MDTQRQAPSQVIIRQANENDFAQLPKIYCQSLRENPRGFVQDLAFHGEITSTTKGFVAQGGETLVACQDDKVLGFGALKPLSDGKIELCKLHVNKQHQQQGIGKKLSENLISRAKELGFKKVELHVTATQQAAIALYQRLGFKKTNQKLYAIDVNKKRCTYDTVFMQLTPS